MRGSVGPLAGSMAGGGGEYLGCWVGVPLTEDLVRVASCSVLTVLDRF